MKKFSGFLAILALVLVFGFTLVSCGGGSAPKTMQGLFDELKGYTEVSLYAYAQGFDTSIVWCGYHQRWEGYQWQDGVGRLHDATPAFDFAVANEIAGSNATINFYGTFAVELRNIVNTLDSFYKDGPKTGAPPYQVNYTNVPSTGLIWYTYYFIKDGRARYGGSAEPTTGPFLADYYQF
jgi:hypothetical protein